MKNTKLKFTDIMLILGIILQDAGNLNIFPFDIFKMIILIVFCYYLFKYIIIQKKLPKIPLTFFVIFIYISIVTLLNLYNSSSIQNILFLIIEIITFIFYCHDQKNYNRIYKVLYVSAFILSLYGIIQVIAYQFGLRNIYDITLYNFNRNANYLHAGRSNSLYSEPAHLCAILASGFFIGLVNRKKVEYTKSYKTLIILIYSLLTFSTLVYISITIFLLYYLINIKKLNSKKTLIAIITFLLLGSVFLYYNQDFVETSIYKAYSLINPDSYSVDDQTGYAIVSNIKIASLKMRDGYIFGTGLYSHQIYYREYFYQIYNGGLMINYVDAASLFTRIFSELGIVGLVAFLMFLIRKIIKNSKRNKNMMFIIILLILEGMRIGHYANILIALPFTILLMNGIKITEGDEKNEKD